MDSFAQSELQNDRSKDGLPRGEITCCHCYPDWFGYWKCDWVLPDSCRLVLADYFMCDGRGWPFAFIIVMIAIHTPVKELRQYLRWKHCDIPIIRENERKFRVAP